MDRDLRHPQMAAVGGSADRLVSSLTQLRLLSRPLAFQFAEEVFKVDAQDRVRQRFLELNTELSFTVFAWERVQRRLLEQIMLS